jgi:hypothetical protein
VYRASCLCNRVIKNIIRDTVEYIDVEALHASVIGRIRILLEIL